MRVAIDRLVGNIQPSSAGQTVEELTCVNPIEGRSLGRVVHEIGMPRELREILANEWVYNTALGLNAHMLKWKLARAATSRLDLAQSKT